MGSKVVSSESYIVSTDIGIFSATLSSVTGYDVEDLVRDKAVSYARAIQMASLGKRIDQSKPIASRTLSSIWLNNEIVLV